LKYKSGLLESIKEKREQLMHCHDLTKSVINKQIQKIKPIEHQT